MEKHNLLKQVLYKKNSFILEDLPNAVEIDNAIKTSLKLNIVLNEFTNISITNASGILTYVNDSFCKTTHFTKEELIGSSHRIINSNEHSKEFYKSLWDVILSGNTWKGEIRNKKKNGEHYWVDTIIHPLKDTHGDIYEFVSLRKNITKQKKLEEQLKEALQEKDILMAELHHRVKNNFMILISILNIKFKNNTNENISAITDDIQAKISSMMALHESLYLKSDLSKVPAKEFIQNVCQCITSIYKNTDGIELFTNIAEDIHFDMNKAMTLSLIINEIITNTCKYAFPEENDNCKLSITLCKNTSNKDYILKINDNGVGFDPKQINPNSYGNILIKTLIEDQLKGSYELLLDEGTCYKIKFPITHKLQFN